MIRAVIVPDKNYFSLRLPDNYIGKKVEVIAFATDEASENIYYSPNPVKHFTAIQLQTKGFKFNRLEANER